MGEVTTGGRLQKASTVKFPFLIRKGASSYIQIASKGNRTFYSRVGDEFSLETGFYKNELYF